MATGELEFLRALRQRVGGPRGGVRLGMGDDCAVLQVPRGHHVVVTTDFSLEGRHFRRDWHPPASAGHRCLARGLSDLAAMGAKPVAAFLSLALPTGLTGRAKGRAWVDGFLEGLLALADTTRTPLAGGDTATAPGENVLTDIVLVGSVPHGTELRRSGAKPGDVLYVTGTLGGAAAELALLSQKPGRFRTADVLGEHPHLFPQPRLRLGERLRGRASAAMDVSDGLSTDLRHLCEASGAGAVVDAEALPLHPLLATHIPEERLRMALHGGEDYELLFTAPATVKIHRRMAGVAVTAIGCITRSRKIVLRRNGEETPLPAGGWEHHL